MATDRKEYPPGSWAGVRDNVNHLGCYGDGAYHYAELEDSRNYFTGQARDFRPLEPPDERLRSDRRKYKTFLDGPARIIPSIEVPFDENNDPRRLPLHRALKRCYDMAKSRHKRYFALQGGGLCLATDSKEFAKWKKLKGTQCAACTRVCTKGTKPCGRKCIPENEECHKKVHTTCMDDSVNKLKFQKGGGYFTNSVYEIKDIDRLDPGVDDQIDESLNDAYKRFRYSKIKVGDHMECADPSKFFELAPRQLFLQQYFTPENPIKGLLETASTGSGKTCAALNVVGNFMPKAADGGRLKREEKRQGWRICWVTSKATRDTPDKELYTNICMSRVRDLIDDKNPITLSTGEVVATTRQEKINYIRENESAKRVLASYGIEFEQQWIITYDDLVDMITARTAEGRKLRDSQLARSPNGDIAYKTFFVVDEAHNLISTSLPADDRKQMDAKHASAKVSGKTFRTLQDIYGKEVTESKASIQGRDLIAAMLYQSYELSKKDSAKIMMLTATPMSTSPSDMFWLMNLFLELGQRLSLNLDEYYDKTTMKLRDSAIAKFSAAAHGRLASYDSTQDATKLAKKIFAGIHAAPMQAFHQRIIDEAVAEAVKNKADTSALATIYNNLSLCAKVKGPFYTPAVIAEHEKDVKRAQRHSAEQESEYHRSFYDQNVLAATKHFKLGMTPADQKAYQKKVDQYHKWLLDSKYDILTASGELKDLPTWLAGRVSNEAERIPDKVKKQHQKLEEKFKEYQAKLRQHETGKINKPRRPQFGELLRADGAPKTLEEFHGVESQSTKHQKRLTAEYEAFAQRYQKGTLPEVPKELQDVVDAQGRLRSELEWYETEMAPKRTVSTKRKSHKDDAKYARFLITDPATGVERIRTQAEFLKARKASPSLDGPETRKDLSMLMTSKLFKAADIRQLLPYYAPSVYECIQNIFTLEKQSRENYGHGFKHVVFTYSVAGVSDWTSAYGARILASAFHAFQDEFKVLLVYGDKADEVRVAARAPLRKKKSTAYRAKPLVVDDDDDSDSGDESDEEQPSASNMGKQKKKKFALRWDVPSNGANDKRWGVSVLSSRSIDNIYHSKYGGNKTVEFNKKVVKATSAAFNDPANKYGDHIKIMILDGIYKEGIDLSEGAFEHFLGYPRSTPQLEQAAARGVRTCRSQNLPFFKGVGAFTELHFYQSTPPNHRPDLNSQLLEHVPYEEQLNVNMIEVFGELSKTMSIDYWLNVNVTRFNPVHQGLIVKYYDDWTERAYLIQLKLTLPAATKGEAAQREVHEFIVDHESVETQMAPGVPVTDKSGKACVIQAFGDTPDVMMVTYKNETRARAVLKSDLRFPLLTKVDFHIPYGVALAQKMLNIGNYSVMHPSELLQTMHQDIKLPELATEAVYTAFRNNVVFTLLGYIAMLESTLRSVKTPMNVSVVMPDTYDENKVPTMADMSISWMCEDSQRVLAYDPDLLTQFLAPRSGISLIILSLTGAKCGNEEGVEQQHSNVLLYIPEWKTIERFDPMGYTSHWYDSVALDARLHDLFRSINPDIRFMSSAEVSPLVGALRMQQEEDARHAMDPSSFSQVFALFYMHMRILHAAKGLSQHAESKEVFPIQFQRGLIHKLGRHASGSLTQYIRAYAQEAVASRKQVVSDKDYDGDLPFWINCVRHIQKLLQTLSKPRVKPEPHSRPKLTTPHKDKHEEVKKPTASIWNKLTQFVPFV